MVVFLLFLILVVLLYATKLLPGVMKVISGFLALFLLLLGVSLYGWLEVLGVFFGALAIVGLGVWLSVFSSNQSKKKRFDQDDIHRQLEKVNAEEKLKREAEKSDPAPPDLPAQPMPAARPSKPIAKPMADDLEQPVEVFFSYQGQSDPAPRKQHVSIQRISTKGGRVFLKAQCLKSGSMKMFMVDRIKGHIASSGNGQQVNPADYTRIEALRGALLQLV